MTAKTEKFKPWRVCFLPQLAHLQGKDEHAYERFGQARDFVNNQIDDWKGWCKRYNSAGLKVLDEMQSTVNETEGWFWQHDLENERVIEGLIDPDTQTSIKVRIRKVQP